ncbi:MAG: hypothetical protein Q7T57_00110, partial [Dehalococcoidales bacterium]|nr:hypothetical protein [Dehalococcoidales bacterium]
RKLKQEGQNDDESENDSDNSSDNDDDAEYTAAAAVDAGRHITKRRRVLRSNASSSVVDGDGGDDNDASFSPSLHRMPRPSLESTRALQRQSIVLSKSLGLWCRAVALPPVDESLDGSHLNAAMRSAAKAGGKRRRSRNSYRDDAEADNEAKYAYLPLHPYSLQLALGSVAMVAIVAD